MLNKSDLLEAIRVVTEEAVAPLKEMLEASSTATTSAKYLTRDEVCNALRISRPTFHKLVRDGVLNITKLGRKTLVDAAELERVSENWRKYDR